MRRMPPEDPFDVWRKRAMGDFPEFFAEFEKEFARMQGMVNRIMEDAMKHANSPQRGEPFVYGFTMRVGKDGVPQIQPFGSAAKDAPGAPQQVDAAALGPADREPLTDIMVGEKDVAITIELPGVEKHDVNLRVAEDAVTVRAETAAHLRKAADVPYGHVGEGRRYHKRIQLPVKVVPSSAKATFKNGILDVTLQREAGSDPGHKVAIE